jgi:hypothetical protein
MGARLYNPHTGRFLSTDPIPGGSANPYEYALQDPYNNLDLDGRAYFGKNIGKFQVAFCLGIRKAKNCAAAWSLGNQANRATAYLKSRNRWGPGQTNAYRHGYWMAMVSSRFGYWFAYGLGRAHELDTPQTSAARRHETQIDLQNNQIGAKFGLGYRNNNALIGDRLAVIVDRTIGYFNYNSKEG